MKKMKMEECVLRGKRKLESKRKRRTRPRGKE